MPRVKEVDDPGDDPLLGEVFAKETEVFGFVLNTTKIQAHTPGIMRAAKQLSAALEYAEAITVTDRKVTEELFARVRAHFSEAQIVELTAAVALENFRSKFNVALGIEAQGFCLIK